MNWLIFSIIIAFAVYGGYLIGCFVTEQEHQKAEHKRLMGEEHWRY